MNHIGTEMSVAGGIGAQLAPFYSRASFLFEWLRLFILICYEYLAKERKEKENDSSVGNKISPLSIFPSNCFIFLKSVLYRNIVEGMKFLCQ